MKRHPSGLDTSLIPDKVARNYEHIWGSYLELPIGEKLMVRVVRIYGHRDKPKARGARNSIHSHLTTEWVMGLSGTIRCYVGKDVDHLKFTDITSGVIAEFPSGSVHRIELIQGEHKENGVPYAELLEIMAGDHQGGTYPIVRHEPAVAADYPKLEDMA